MRRLARDTGGAIGLLGGAALGIGIGCLALAVDLGSVYSESRRLQGIADAAALSAAGNLSAAQAAAEAAIPAKTGIELDLELGRYTADPALAPAARFAGGAPTPDAARVTLSREAPLFFGVAALGQGSMRITRSATAVRRDLAAFSIGSRLAALDGGIANALLGALTGSSVSLSLMDHQALIAADIDLFGFVEALRTQAQLEGASFDETLATDITPPRALAALATALDHERATAAAAAIRKLAAGTMVATPVRLDRLIDLGPIGAQDHAAAGQPVRVSAFDLMRGTLQLANGQRQLALDLGAGVPGLVRTRVKLAVGDRAVHSPWLTLTAAGDPIIRTAQTRLYLEADVLPGGLGFGVSAIRLPVYVELAEAQARLAAVRCDPATGDRGVTLSVRPSPGHVAIADIPIGQLTDHRTAVTENPAKLVSVPLLSVTGKARVDLAADAAWQPVSFDRATIVAHEWKTVTAGTLLQGVVASLVSNLTLEVKLLGLGLGAGAVGPLVGAGLTPAAPALDGVVNALTGLLGIHIGQADVRVDGVRCGTAALVG